MQLKGLVKFFTIALILISLYQLSFTFVVRSVDKKARAQAERSVATLHPQASAEEKNALIENRFDQITDSLQGEVVYNTLLKKYTYQQAKEQELNLGLDLQGGMNVTLEVSLDELVRSMSNNPKDPALNKAIADAERLKANSDADFISLFGQAWQQNNANQKLAYLFTKPSEEKISLNSTNAEVLALIKSEASDAVKRTHNVIQTRIDKFGVAQPNVNLDMTKGIISVELAGVRNPERVRNFLQSTALLQFWEVYVEPNLVESFIKANESLGAYLSGNTTQLADTTQQPSSLDVVAADNATEDTAAVATASTSDTGSLSSLLGNSTTDSGQNTIAGTSAANKDPLTSLLVQNDGSDPAAFAYIPKKNISKFFEYLELDVVKNKLPSNVRFYVGADNSKTRYNANGILPLYAVKTIPGSTTAKLEGDKVVDARADFDPVSGRPEVSMTMNPSGARAWSKMTGDNVGKFIAIVLDDKVYSAPRVNQQIDGGRSSISGAFTTEEATDLANILKSGKLPAPARIVQEQVVGPTLGEESIRAGGFSLAASFIVIFILMVIYYNTGGIVANIALVLNLLFTFGILSALGATLTMPGIAGLVLTIGMAVDTNVIIFERIKEELALGKTYEQAVSDGYRRSYAPVLDGHFTQLLTAVILFYFGLGPVLGFATTQIIGLLLSLFTGILVSRLITDIYMRKGRHFKYFTAISEQVFKKANFRFIEMRKVGYIISAIVLLLGVASFFNGFDYGVEFNGGRSYTIQFDEKYQVSDVREKLHTYFDDEYPIVKTIGTDNTLNITTSYLIEKPGTAVSDEVRSKLFDGLTKSNLIPAGTTPEDFEAKYLKEEKTVLPTISDDLKKGAIKATLFSLIAIFLYIFLRFRKWQYSIGTVIALMFDVSVTLIVFSFLKGIVPFALEIDQHFIAAVLTVIGFSMNDTIIVFDRIRENFRNTPNADKLQVINKSINDTLSRTIMTSLTVLLTVLILFIFGGEALRGFSFAMLVGVISGIFSSIFVAAPVLVDLDKRNKLSQEVDRDERIRELKNMA